MELQADVGNQTRDSTSIAEPSPSFNELGIGSFDVRANRNFRRSVGCGASSTIRTASRRVRAVCFDAHTRVNERPGCPRVEG